MFTSDDLAALKQQLIAHEGLRLKPYHDTVGKLTIGVGHNLTDLGITHAQALALLEDDLTATINGLLEALPWTRLLPATQFRVLVDVAFNTGLDGLLRFHQMLAAVQKGDYETAAREVVNSHLAPRRAQRLAALMRTTSIEVVRA